MYPKYRLKCIQYFGRGAHIRAGEFHLDARNAFKNIENRMIVNGYDLA
jgi:hypothetical protein